jgi:hypothetical protein
VDEENAGRVTSEFRLEITGEYSMKMLACQYLCRVVFLSKGMEQRVSAMDIGTGSAGAPVPRHFGATEKVVVG